MIFAFFVFVSLSISDYNLSMYDGKYSYNVDYLFVNSFA